MESKERIEQYTEYVHKRTPTSKEWPSLFYAFLIGGAICCFGQGISDGVKWLFPYLSEQDVGSWMLVVLIFFTCLFTGLGLFDKLGAIAGAGTIIPITGFANSIASPSMEYRREGIIFGLCAKMFTVAGPVIVSGVTTSVIVGIIYLFIPA